MTDDMDTSIEKIAKKWDEPEIKFARILNTRIYIAKRDGVSTENILKRIDRAKETLLENDKLEESQ